MLTVTIPVDVQQALRKALKAAGTDECGGVLMGEHVGPGHFAVRHLSVQGGGRFASFVRQTQSALRALRKFFNQSGHDYERFNYLGEWHSHPSFSVQPSPTDHQSMLDIVMDVRVGANFVVLLIFKVSHQGDLEGSAHTYLPDGSHGLSTLVLAGAA
ncbi:Mov34/MPN/PAD-1 family protein [Rhodoferax sp. U11-2br]|uniref:Mov34/MPN/PAD-1 family protein n=1 Tax=Rhodoferax sp. U11-2br TaxID=2838878 RepID=UPI001BE8347A|nr:Mov34/MPN/PAD-1 family protein [Rhodoferax sp. U11-2br]MBT3067968.1 Mov34/MPN/PAD-1 family protein [Rhodoferax sp. U11-2br]